MTADINKVLNTANAFIRAAERNEEQRSIANNKIEMLLVPAVTNRAFSIELYFKAILTKENNSSKGHKLHELFSKSKADTQKKIIRLCKLSDSEFDQKLREITNLFVEWRYIYEADEASLNWEYLKTLSTAVKKVAIDYNA